MPGRSATSARATRSPSTIVAGAPARSWSSATCPASASSNGCGPTSSPASRTSSAAPLTPIRGFASVLLRRGDQLDDDQRAEALTRIVDRADHLHEPRRGPAPRHPDRPRRRRRAGARRTRRPRPAHPRGRGPHPHRGRRADHHLRGRRRPAARARRRGSRRTGGRCTCSTTRRATRSPTPPSRSRWTPTATTSGSASSTTARGSRLREREAVFERFHRLEDPMTMRTGGVGVGLFLGRRLARGHARVPRLLDTPAGDGAVLELRLPVAAPSTPTAIHPMAHEIHGAPPRGSGPSR